MAGLKRETSLAATVDPRAIDRRSGKPKRVPKKLKEVIRLLLDGTCKTVKAAGERAGLTSESYLSVALRQPHVLAYIDERTRGTLAEGKTIAAARLLNLIHSKSDHVSFDAAAHVLGINNIAPPAANAPMVNVNVNPGYIISMIDPRTGKFDDGSVPIDVQPEGGEQ